MDESSRDWKMETYNSVSGGRKRRRVGVQNRFASSLAKQDRDPERKTQSFLLFEGGVSQSDREKPAADWGPSDVWEGLIWEELGTALLGIPRQELALPFVEKDFRRTPQ